MQKLPQQIGSRYNTVVQHIQATWTGAYYHLRCGGCGRELVSGADWQTQRFYAAHAACARLLRPVDPRYYGAGDLVARVAKPVAQAMGRDPNCAPCAQRQAALNQMFPRVWRR